MYDNIEKILFDSEKKVCCEDFDFGDLEELLTEMIYLIKTVVWQLYTWPSDFYDFQYRSVFFGLNNVVLRFEFKSHIRTKRLYGNYML